MSDPDLFDRLSELESSPPPTARGLARKTKTKSTVKASAKGDTKTPPPAQVEDNVVDIPAELQDLIDDHRAVSEEIDTAQREAFDQIDGRRFVHTASGGAMPMEDVQRLLTLCGVPAQATRKWSAEYLAGVTHRHGAVVTDAKGESIPLSVITDVDPVGDGLIIYMTTAQPTAVRIAQATATATALATAMREATGGVVWRAEVVDKNTFKLTSRVKYNARSAAAKKIISAVSPRFTSLGDQRRAASGRTRGEESWKQIALKAGLVEETVIKEKFFDHTARKQVEVPRKRYVSSWPKSFVLGDGEVAGMAFSTPAEITLDRWKKALPVLENLLGVAGLSVTRTTPGEVVLWLPRETKTMTSFVPGADQLTHIAAAGSEAEARSAAVAAHSSFRWVLGRTSEGEVLGEKIARAPHALVAGGTGAGKSTWVTWLASCLVAAGSDVILCDGKGSSDYDGIARSLPNVKLISKSAVEHVAALQWLCDEMDHRYAVESARGRSGVERDRQNYHRPTVMVFDEYGAFKEALGSDSGALGADINEIDSLVTRVLQKGRAARVHLVFVSQSIYAETLPGKQKNNVPVRLSLGVPASHTLRETVGTDQLFDEAKALAASIPRGRPGQGIAVATSEVDGEPHAQRISVPYGYVPGAPGTRAPEVQTVWDSTREEVFDRLVELTPRMALAFDAPVDVADRGKKIPAPQSWQEYGLHEIRQLPWVRVSSWHGQPPPPGAERYDVLSEDYGGDQSTSTAAKYH